MGEKIDIKWEYADRFTGLSGRIGFDVSLRGKSYLQFRDDGTAEGAKIAADIRATARRFGDFDWIQSTRDKTGADTPVERFMTTRPLQGNEARALVDAFRDQGYDVRPVGAYVAGKVLTRQQTEDLPHAAYAAGARLEEAHARARREAREGSMAGALSDLRSAARAEEARDTLRALQTGNRDEIRLPTAAPAVVVRSADRRRLIEAHDKKVCYQTEAPQLVM